ncbi:hypothetical protein GCM10010178_88530 [Lentzea flava]|uniref:FAS1-like dehydratase domain-containing protein n=1 Tax=Lentzea flava TaxID=103732 RepID=A0ABQ2VIR3_9PSEU|nr:hypothetical protein GCM10010178_88530 [Lentzea flava]
MFLAPVRPGDELTVTLTVKAITPRRGTDHGEVRWDVEVTNQRGQPIARYDLLVLTPKHPAAVHRCHARPLERQTHVDHDRDQAADH